MATRAEFDEIEAILGQIEYSLPRLTNYAQKKQLRRIEIQYERKLHRKDHYQRSTSFRMFKKTFTDDVKEEIKRFESEMHLSKKNSY